MLAPLTAVHDHSNLLPIQPQILPQTAHRAPGVPEGHEIGAAHEQHAVRGLQYPRQASGTDGRNDVSGVNDHVIGPLPERPQCRDDHFQREGRVELRPLDPGQNREPRAVLQLFLNPRVRCAAVAIEGEADDPLPWIEVQVSRHIAAAHIGVKKSNSLSPSGERRGQADRHRRLARRSLAARNGGDLAAAASSVLVGAATRLLSTSATAVMGLRPRIDRPASLRLSQGLRNLARR
jgi:hypothetical protein